MSDTVHTIARAEARIGTAAPYLTSITADGHALKADEDAHGGGQGAGPSPFGLLLSGLGACTAITLRMYAERKGWPLTDVRVDLAYRTEGERKFIDRTLRLEGPLDAEQRARMADIAERTPVTLAVKNGLQVTTKLEE
jgi:putative redox protein